MRSFIKALFFDREMVDTIRQAHVEKEYLYTLVFSGQITMKEYIAAVS